MPEQAGFPYFELQFNKEGAPVNPAELGEIAQSAVSNPPDHLLVMSHGWNNDMEDARSLYRLFLESLGEVKRGFARADGRPTFAFIGVLWPSMKFADKSLVPGGEAGMDSAADRLIRAQLAVLKKGMDSSEASQALDEAAGLVDRLEDSPEARKRFADLVRSVLPASAPEGNDDVTEGFLAGDGGEIMEALSQPMAVAPAEADREGGAASLEGGGGSDAEGEAAFLGLETLFGGIKLGALRVANLATYWTMKERAGLVGAKGLAPILQRLRGDLPATTKIHLVGHSFGGRLVTSAAHAARNLGVKVASLSLLQAAFSHYGFASRFDGKKDGFFRPVILDQVVRGPILITHSVKDKAVGQAYPLASMLARQDASALGDGESRWGGIGRNGARKTPEAIDVNLLPPGGDYGFQGGVVYNLKAEAFISGHSDITGKAVAYAVFKAATWEG